MGVTTPIKHTADSAFTFQTEPKDHNMLQKIWDKEVLPEPSRGFVGLAIIDFYLWPVVIRPWGPKENLGIKNIEYNYLVDNVTHIIHTAADLRLNAPPQKI